VEKQKMMGFKVKEEDLEFLTNQGYSRLYAEEALCMYLGNKEKAAEYL